MSKKQLSVYKLDNTYYGNPASFLRSFDSYLLNDKGFDKISKFNLKTDDEVFDIFIYQKNKSFSNGFLEYIREYIDEEVYTDIEDRYRKRSSDTLILFYSLSESYAVSAWYAYSVLSELIDELFPIKLIKSEVIPQFKSAELSEVVWTTYNSRQIYRWEYSFDFFESYGKIRKELTWKLRDDSIIKQILNLEGDANATFKPNSFRIWKSITFEELKGLICRFNEVLSRPLSADQKNAYKFIDMIKAVKWEKKNQIINQFISQNIIPLVKWEIDGVEKIAELEFVSSKNTGDFISFPDFKIKFWRRETEEFNIYSVHDGIIEFSQEKYDWSFPGEDILVNDFKACKLLYSIETPADNYDISEFLYKCFHWEYNDWTNTYFILDGNVYQMDTEFISDLKSQFIDLLSSDLCIDSSSLKLENYNSDENEFNESHIQSSNVYCFHRIFDNDKVELFDLLYFDEENNELYIIHVKPKLTADTRILCAQLYNSMDKIERYIESGNYWGFDDSCLWKVYDRAFSYTWTADYLKELSKQELEHAFYKNLFIDPNIKRNYVALFLTDWHIPNAWNIWNKFRSNIAFYEIIRYKQYFKSRSSNFLITFV